MMNAYFFQMNNLKGLAADESGGSVLVERFARSERFTVRLSVGWTSSACWEKQRRSSGQQSTARGWSWLNSHLSWIKGFLWGNTKFDHPENGTREEQKCHSPVVEGWNLTNELLMRDKKKQNVYTPRGYWLNICIDLIVFWDVVYRPGEGCGNINKRQRLYWIRIFVTILSVNACFWSMDRQNKNGSRQNTPS